MLAQQNNLTNNVTPFQAPVFVDRSLPPSNIDAEESIIGGILLGGLAALERVKEILSPNAFHLTAHRKIYKAILSLENKNKKIDLMLLVEELKGRPKVFEEIGGTTKLVHLLDRTVSDVNIDRYAELVQEKYLKRQAIYFSNVVQDYCYSKEKSISELAETIKEIYNEVTGSPLATGGGKSLKLHQCDRLLDKINHIQFHIDSPTQKEFLMQDLARESGRSKNELQTLFYKSLIEDEWEPTLNLSQLRDKYGDTVREWLLHGFIPKGATTLIHALGGHGKTRLSYDFIYNLALGEAWQGFPVSKKAKVMIIQTDEQPVDMLNALEQRGITADDPRFDIHYKTRWSVEHIPQLYQEVEKERYDIILIDSLASISKYSTVSENDAEFAKPILLLNKIAADFNTAILLIHHSSKQGDARGTTAVYNAVSQVFQLTKDINDHNPASLNRVLTIQKSRARRPAKYLIAFNPEDGSWRFDGEDTPVTDIHSPLKEQIIQYLSQHRGIRWQNRDLAQNLNQNENSVRRSLNELASDGILSWKKEGKSRFFWLEHFEANVTKSQYDQPDQGGDQMGDQMVDQTANACPVSDTAMFDQRSPKNQEKRSENFGKKVDHLITTPETHTQQGVGFDQPFDHPFDHPDQLIKPDQIKKGDRQPDQPDIKKGDRLIIRDGCAFYPKVDIEWEAGTVVEVMTIGLTGMYLNQLQVKKLGDPRCAAWIPIANVELMQVCKEV